VGFHEVLVLVVHCLEVEGTSLRCNFVREDQYGDLCFRQICASRL